MEIQSHRIKDLDDLTLIECYKKDSNIEYISEVYYRYQTMVIGVSMKLLKNRAEADDALMDIYEVVRKDALKYDIKHFKSWLYMVVRNFCYMKLNKDKRIEKKKTEYKHHVQSDFMESSSSFHLTEEQDEKEKQFDHLEECLKTLKEVQKICVSMFYLKEQSYVEIAEETNYELKKVKSYIQNGKRNLKICLESKSG